MACPDTDHWDIVYAYACRTFGQTPMAEAERTVFDAFLKYPALVRNEIDSVKTALDSGKVKWAWSALATRVDRQTPFAAEADSAKEKQGAVKQAERYVIHAGCHYDKWEGELEDEFFGALGRLREWGDDPAIRARLQQLWETNRDAAVAAESQQDEDAALRREQRAASKAQREAVRLEGERTSTAALVAAGAEPEEF
jgi:hypothetical protein